MKKKDARPLRHKTSSSYPYIRINAHFWRYAWHFMHSDTLPPLAFANSRDGTKKIKIKEALNECNIFSFVITKIQSLTRSLWSALFKVFFWRQSQTHTDKQTHTQIYITNHRLHNSRCRLSENPTYRAP